MSQLILIILLFISVILHEIAHGYTALLFGDPTAKNLGRLSLNPIVHMDIIGSVLLPVLCVLTGSGFFIGWAKPVPVDPTYFRHPSRDMMWVALAGPLTNFSLAWFAGVALKLAGGGAAFQPVLEAFVYLNVTLAVFNLLPIPPLDGSKILAHFLPYQAQIKLMRFEGYGFILIFALAYLGVLFPIIRFFAEPLVRMFL